MIRYISLLIAFGLLTMALPFETNATQSHHIDITLTVTGMQEGIASIQATSKEITALTEKLSNKQDFNDEDREHINALAIALNNNADAIRNIANAFPNQLEHLQGSAVNLLDHVAQDAQKVVASSKNDLIDPTLDRIQTQVILFVLLLGGVLIGVIWFGLWQIRSIASTGSETIANITQTMKSLEKVLEKVQEKEPPKDP